MLHWDVTLGKIFQFLIFYVASKGIFSSEEKPFEITGYQCINKFNSCRYLRRGMSKYGTMPLTCQKNNKMPWVYSNVQSISNSKN